MSAQRKISWLSSRRRFPGTRREEVHECLDACSVVPGLAMSVPPSTSLSRPKHSSGKVQLCETCGTLGVHDDDAVYEEYDRVYFCAFRGAKKVNAFPYRGVCGRAVVGMDIFIQDDKRASSCPSPVAHKSVVDSRHGLRRRGHHAGRVYCGMSSRYFRRAVEGRRYKTAHASLRMMNGEDFGDGRTDRRTYSII